MPTRKADATSHIIKAEVGNVPDFADIFMKAIIPVTTTMIVRVKGILRDSLILVLVVGPLTKCHLWQIIL
jgi:hypothetical protein